MLRYGDYKYIYYVGYPPQLYHIKDDPHEDRDLAGRPEYQEIQAMMDRKLREIGDPEAIDSACRRDQEKRLEQYGGREEIKRSFVPIILSLIHIYTRSFRNPAALEGRRFSWT